MRAFFVAMLFLTMGTAHAVQGTFASKDKENQPMSVVFTDQACTDEKLIAIVKKESAAAHPILAIVVQDPETKFKQSFLNWKGKQYKSCYYEFADRAFSFDELGDMLTPVPLDLIQETAREKQGT